MGYRRLPTGLLALACALIAPDRAAADAPDCGLEDPAVARSAPAVPAKPREVRGLGATGLAPVRRIRPPSSLAFEPVGNGQAGGALSGKTVYVSAGHGWVWRDSGVWRTQRGNTHDLVEDFISTETVSHYLIRYLRNMGAYVVPVRESDWNPNRVVVDDGDADLTGAPAPRDEADGYAAPALPIADQTNPFSGGGSRVVDASTSETGEVVWTFDVPESGSYNVYVSWVQDPSRASDAHYIVRHAGGETHFRVDQRRHGSTWVLLGRFWFDAGASPMWGAVALADDSADAGATLSVDAVRIGGGVGVIDRGGGANGRPMFESCARYNAQLLGAPATVYDYASADGSDDVGTRSRFAAWDHEDGEDAVYIAWHTNAPDPARGTSSFVYGPSSYGPLSEFTGTAGSLELVDFVHTELVDDFRIAWESDWRDRGQHSAYFGEVNPNHNPEMPAALFEIAFHDTAADAEALRDPRFRSLAARAMAHGVARYFADADGGELTLPPEPPADVRIDSDGDGGLVASWRQPDLDPAGGDAATGYRVYRSRDGYAFDDGEPVTGTSLAIAGDAAPLYVRVTATNAGGESFPTRVVGARAPDSGAARVLLVGGFDRLDGGMLIPEDLSDYDLATIERGLIERINDGAHLARYGAALDAAEVSFASASATAVGAGEVDLAPYALVIWQLGEESAAHDPLTADERAAIAAYLAGGGRLVVTGSELAVALGDQGSPDDALFLEQTLHVRYAADDAGTYGVAAAAGEVFDGMAAIRFDDRAPGGYDADAPDVVEPADGAAEVLSYDGGGAAASLWRDDSGARLLFLGFPFETVNGADARADLMARILAAFEIEPDPPTGDPGDPDGGDNSDLAGGCCDSGGGAGGGALLALMVLAATVRRRSA
jgi:N-acetylmuramoyl-L-alanine amidase